MFTPFIFITTHKLQEGQLDEFTAMTERYTQFIEANEPNLMGHFTYLNEDRTEASLVQVHTDAASADRHMQVAAELIGQGVGHTDGNVRIEVYGTPGPLVQKALETNASNGIQVSVKTSGLAGFSRV
ncbi:MAG: hypothetical protein ACRDOY_10445 [Nocardioidaceae bacterium]